MDTIKLNQEDAIEIANWHYDGIYAFYDLICDLEDYEELINPYSSGDGYYSVKEND